MKDFPLPVRVVGAGSQPAEDEELQYMPMPREMNTFEMPRVPERANPDALLAARTVLGGFLDLLAAWDPEGAERGPQVSLNAIPPHVLTLVNEMLGEGEVSIRVDGERSYRIQESVFTGLWRVCALDGEGRLADDWLEASPLPAVVTDVARASAASAPPLVNVPPGAMNSPALLTELGSQMGARRDDDVAHVINLTLFPMTPEDHAVMEQALPNGPVAMISRGFGNCHITSTSLRDVWRVQYFNSMKTLILNTVEVVAVPAVALAAPEDLVESRERLAELVTWLDDTVADAVAH